jgi:predicted NBD/HSP70 family sugar kinase
MKAVLNPEAAIIGGGIAQTELLLDMIRERLDRKEILFPDSLGGIQVVRARFHHLAGAVGAAAWAMREKTE